MCALSNQLLNLRCRLLKIIIRKQRQPALANDALALFFIRAPNPHHHGHFDMDLPKRQQHAARNHISQRQTAKDVDEYDLDAWICQHQLERMPHRLAGGFAAGVEKVGGEEAVRGESVDCVHCETGAVDDGAYVCAGGGEADVDDAVGFGGELGWVGEGCVAQAVEVWMAVGTAVGGVVEDELRV